MTERGKDVKPLLPLEKQKHAPKPLRDPMTEEIFELLVFHAGSLSSYQKKIRQVTCDDVFHLVKGKNLKIILQKTNGAHPCRLSAKGVQKLTELKPKIHLLAKTKKF